MAGSKFVRNLDDDHQREFARLFDAASTRQSRWKVFEDFVVMAAISISNRVDLAHAEEREARYMRKVRDYEEAELACFPRMLSELTLSLTRNPSQDFMGKLFMNLELGNSQKGQFFTPYNVSRMLAEVSVTEELLNAEEPGIHAVNDPSCGAGGMLIAAANAMKERGVNYQTHGFFTGQDIDETAACMCYIQMSLLGMPGYVVVGDTLSRPARVLDKRGLIPAPGQEVWYTPMYFSEVWHWRRVWGRIDALFTPKESGVSANETA